MRRIVIMGAAGRDFHDFATVFRDDPTIEVVAFTAAQIPGIGGRFLPPALAGPRYEHGIPIRPDAELELLIREWAIDEVVLSYSDLSHDEVGHLAARVLGAGADFRMLGPRATMLTSPVPVVAVCAVRTGCGKSQTTRRVARILEEEGFRPVLVRHPMPYGDLERQRVQRFASLADIDAADPTIEEREEYEAPVRLGMVVYAGVDYAAILASAAAEADVIVWDGGNNDLPFFAPDVHLTLTDALRPGHERTFHPGETNLRRADIVIVNKVDGATAEAVAGIEASIAEVNPTAMVVRTASPAKLEDGPKVAGARVLVVEDGPTLTHGGMPTGAGAVAARAAGATCLVDPRPYAVGSLADAFAQYPAIGPVLPAMGYGPRQLRDLEATIQATPCDVVVTGTPIDLSRLIDLRHPARRASYSLKEVGPTTLTDALEPWLRKWRNQGLGHRED